MRWIDLRNFLLLHVFRGFCLTTQVVMGDGLAARDALFKTEMRLNDK